MTADVSRRRFIALAGAGVATVAGGSALYGVRRLSVGADAGGDVADSGREPGGQRVVIETRYTPAGVAYLAAVGVG
jgi:hypothetical protein